MQQLGELKAEEITQFENISSNTSMQNTYNHFKKPTGGFFWYFSHTISAGGLGLGMLVAKGAKSISWHYIAPLLFTVVGHMVAHF